ncbi:MAG: aminoacyl-tRNA hydrolase [Alphaproteobacteria bacterium]|nr:aminoacyl-tRNA hydrolase [Alphaproteobacteria bacterium]
MLLLVGLGNPGREYAANRHNVGFLAVDAIARRHGFTPWRSRFQGMAADGIVDGEKVLALKPMTYMNESGRAVGEAARFFRLAPAEVLVLHDEIDLAPAKTRVKTGGGTAGHNGLRSIEAHLKSAEFRRVRIGVGHPGVRERVHGHVLSDFAKADQAWLDPLIEAIAADFPLLVAGRDSDFMSRLAAATAPARPPKPARPKAADATPSTAPAQGEASPAGEPRGTIGAALRRALDKARGRGD